MARSAIPEHPLAVISLYVSALRGVDHVSDEAASVLSSIAAQSFGTPSAQAAACIF